MNASQHIATLNKFNTKQSIRQNLMTDNNRAILKSALKRSMSDDLENTRVWSKALLLNK